MSTGTFASTASTAASEWLNRQLLRDLPQQWRVCYLFFSAANMLTIGSHWMINPVKFAVFFSRVGTAQEPIARSLTPLVMFPVLMIYNLLVSRVQRPRLLVVIILSVYGVLYAIMAFASALHPDEAEWIGWTFFLATETKGVVVNVVVWSVVNDISDPAYVKQAYPVLSFTTQLGAILGSLCAVSVKKFGGTVGLMVLQAAALFASIALVWFACEYAAHATAAAEASNTDLAVELAQTSEPKENKENSDNLTSTPAATGLLPTLKFLAEQLFEIFNGVRLIATRPYVAMTFWVSCSHMVIRQMIDYQGNVLVKNAFDTKVEQVAFSGKVLLVCSISTCLLTSLGTRSIVEKCGLQIALLVLPIAMMSAMIVLVVFYGFWPACVITIVVNSITYGLNGPCREMLYVRTSRDIKYKAKSWADMYGNFLHKTLGAQINYHVNRQHAGCGDECFNRSFTLIVTIVWTSIWAGTCWHVGRIHAQLEREDKKIE